MIMTSFYAKTVMYSEFAHRHMAYMLQKHTYIYMPMTYIYQRLPIGEHVHGGSVYSCQISTQLLLERG